MCNKRDERTMTEAELTLERIKNLKAHIDYLERQNERLRGEIEGLRFAVRCNGVSGFDMRYKKEEEEKYNV